MVNKAILVKKPSQGYLKSLIETIPIVPKRRSLALSLGDFACANDDVENACKNSMLTVAFNETLGDFCPTIRQSLTEFLERKEPEFVEFYFNSLNQFDIIRNNYLEKLSGRQYKISELNFHIINDRYPAYRTQISLSQRVGLEIKLSDLDQDAQMFSEWIEGLKR